jgi:flagellar basal body rod protein FlgC
MVDMMIAQRAFSAELRVVRSQMEMSDEAVRLGDSRATPP